MKSGSPRPPPETGTAPEIPEEILGLPKRLKEREEKEEETRKGVEWLASQVEEIQERVSELLDVLKPTLPVPLPVPWPLSPPRGFTQAGKRSRRDRGRKAADDL